MRIYRIVYILTAGIFLFVAAIGSFAADVPDFSSLKNTEDLASDVSSTAAFTAGSGHSAGMTTSSFPGLKLGAGATLGLYPGVYDDLSSLDTTDPKVIQDLVSAFPMFYPSVFAKIGLPSTEVPLLKTTDIGVRAGYLPVVDLGQFVSVAKGDAPVIETGGFLVGAEFRTLLIDLSIFNLDMRASFDYMKGSSRIGAPLDVYDTSVDFGYKNSWSGGSFGLRTLAGIDLDWIFGVRAGAGINVNFGDATSSMYIDSSDKRVEKLVGDIESSTANFDPFDIRVMGGIKLFIVDLYAEYGILSERFAATIMPVTLELF